MLIDAQFQPLHFLPPISKLFIHPQLGKLMYIQIFLPSKHHLKTAYSHLQLYRKNTQFREEMISSLILYLFNSAEIG
jgi:hypothetical protein